MAKSYHRTGNRHGSVADRVVSHSLLDVSRLENMVRKSQGMNVLDKQLDAVPCSTLPSQIVTHLVHKRVESRSGAVGLGAAINCLPTLSGCRCLRC